MFNKLKSLYSKYKDKTQALILLIVSQDTV